MVYVWEITLYCCNLGSTYPLGTEVTKESPLFYVTTVFPWRFYIIFYVFVLSTGLVNEIDSTTWGGRVKTGSALNGLWMVLGYSFAIGVVIEACFCMVKGWVTWGWTAIETGLFPLIFSTFLIYETATGLWTCVSTFLTYCTGTDLWICASTGALTGTVLSTGTSTGRRVSTDLFYLWTGTSTGLAWTCLGASVLLI